MTGPGRERTTERKQERRVLRWQVICLSLLVAHAAFAQSGPQAPAPPKPKARTWTDVPARKRGPLVLLALSMAVGAADVEFTKHCIGIGTCREANPFMPRSRAGQYAIKSVISTSFFFQGWGLRGSRHPRLRKIWWLPQAAWIGANIYGAWTGERLYGRIR